MFGKVPATTSQMSYTNPIRPIETMVKPTSGSTVQGHQDQGCPGTCACTWAACPTLAARARRRQSSGSRHVESVPPPVVFIRVSKACSHCSMFWPSQSSRKASNRQSGTHTFSKDCPVKSQDSTGRAGSPGLRARRYLSGPMGPLRR